MLHHKIHIKEGATEWVVFVHGAGGSSSVWYRQIKSFSQEFNLLLIDLRGHGKSESIEEINSKKDYSFKAIAKEIIEVVDHYQIKNAHFVGVSLGTIIIRQIADIDASYIKSMILTGAVTRLNIKSRFLLRMGRSLKSIIPNMMLYKLFAYIIMPKKNHAKSRFIFIREAEKIAKKEFLRWFSLTAQLASYLQYLYEKDIGIPTLYIMGEEDHLFLEPVKQLVNKMKNARLQVVEKCGHVVNIEQAEIFNAISIKFIKQPLPA
jgi:pimeloyl-ACP methyl ester carboxylesterase